MNICCNSFENSFDVFFLISLVMILATVSFGMPVTIPMLSAISLKISQKFLHEFSGLSLECTQEFCQRSSRRFFTDFFKNPYRSITRNPSSFLFKDFSKIFIRNFPKISSKVPHEASAGIPHEISWGLSIIFFSGICLRDSSKIPPAFFSQES